jgi:hypothetical protein
MYVLVIFSNVRGNGNSLANTIKNTKEKIMNVNYYNFFLQELLLNFEIFSIGYPIKKILI